MERADLIFQAKVFEQVNSYDEMIEVIKLMVQQNPVLNVQERNLLSIAYKSGVSSLRTACRSLKSAEKKEQIKNSDSKNLIQIKEYQSKIQEQLIKYGNDIIELLDNIILPATEESEPTIFFLKLKADYLRYLCECTHGKVNEEYMAAARQCYEKASESAKSSLATTDPTRLGLALNYSVFYYEVVGDIKKACEISKEAFDSGIMSIDQITQQHYKESTTLLQLLRDNMAQWASDSEQS